MYSNSMLNLIPYRKVPTCHATDWSARSLQACKMAGARRRRAKPMIDPSYLISLSELRAIFLWRATTTWLSGHFVETITVSASLHIQRDQGSSWCCLLMVPLPYDYKFLEALNTSSKPRPNPPIGYRSDYQADRRGLAPAKRALLATELFPALGGKMLHDTTIR